MSDLADELRFHAKMQIIPEGTAAIMNSAADEIEQLRADAARYQYLKEHCSYYFSEGYNPPSPREFGIEWHWQDSTPARPNMDGLIDREIEERRVLAEIDTDEALTVPSDHREAP